MRVSVKPLRLHHPSADGDELHAMACESGRDVGHLGEGVVAVVACGRRRGHFLSDAVRSSTRARLGRRRPAGCGTGSHLIVRLPPTERRGGGVGPMAAGGFKGCSWRVRTWTTSPAWSGSAAGGRRCRCCNPTGGGYVVAAFTPLWTSLALLVQTCGGQDLPNGRHERSTATRGAHSPLDTRRVSPTPHQADSTTTPKNAPRHSN